MVNKKKLFLLRKTRKGFGFGILLACCSFVKCSMWSDWKEQIKHQPEVRHSLLWEYDLCSFDWQYMRALVVERVIERGWDEDYYALFALYAGMDGVRRIIRDEVLILSDKDIAFVCIAFNLKKEDLKCYIRKLL